MYSVTFHYCLKDFCLKVVQTEIFKVDQLTIKVINDKRFFAGCIDP